MSTPALARVNTTSPHQVMAYLVTPTAVAGDGTCTVTTEEGDTLQQVPFYGSPVIGEATPMIMFDGQLAVLGMGSALATVNPGLVAASGWSVSTSFVQWDSKWASLYFNVTRTGANIAGTSRGNIANSTIATLVGAAPTPVAVAGMSVAAGALLVGGALNPDGTLVVTFSPPTIGINTGDSFNGTVIYAHT